ncbi:hypothetical protein N7527_008857 [Penicillium freii]|nr:hypothetical protein N7527_008857 [Penicillium freii]
MIGILCRQEGCIQQNRKKRENVLWNEELGRALIIDFHRSTLECRPTLQQSRAVKRQLYQPETGDPKRLHII